MLHRVAQRQYSKVWVGNGYTHFKMYPSELKIPVSQRYRVYKAVNEIPAARFKSNNSGFYWSLIMELPDKTQKEMSEAIKIMAVSAFTEKSQNLNPS